MERRAGELAAQGVPAPRQLGVLRLVGLALRGPAPLQRHHELGGGRADRPVGHARPSALVGGAGRHREPDRAGLLQILRLLRRTVRRDLERLRLGARPAAAADRAAYRHLVLHFPGHLLRGGRASGRLPQGRLPLGRDAAALVLPAPRGWPDRAGAGPLAPVRPDAPPYPADAHRRVPAGGVGSLQEDGDRLGVVHGLGRSGVLRPFRSRRGRFARRDLRLRRSDLLRLLGLQRHRYRGGGAARLQLPTQLRPALPSHLPARILDSAGTSACRAGYATTSTSPSAAIAAAWRWPAAT